MTDASDDDEIWDLPLAALCERIGDADGAWRPGQTALVAAVLGLRSIRRCLVRAAEASGEPIGRNRFGPLVESVLRLASDLSGHVETVRIVADEREAAGRAGLPPPAILQAAIEMPLNAAQTCVEALDLAGRAIALADARAIPDVQVGVELLAAAGRSMLHLAAPLIGRIPDAAQAADYRRSVAHFGRSLRDRVRDLEDLARRRTA